MSEPPASSLQPPASPLPAWLTDAERSRLERFRQRVRALLGPRLVKLCLFGSRARGEGHAESDLDVLVVYRAPEDYAADHDLRLAIAGIQCDISEEDGYPLSAYLQAIVLRQDDWQFNIDRELLFAREVLEQGIPL